MTLEAPPEQHTVTDRSVHNFIDSHLRELKWSAYGLAGIGVILVLQRVKAGTKFRHVTHIPEHFLTKNYRLQGHVRKVCESGQLLVEHVPIVQFDFLSRTMGGTDHLLPVTVAGVALTPEATNYLTETVLDRHIWFRLMQLDDGSSLDCDVTLKQSRIRRPISLSEELVRHGLCAVRHFESPPSSQAYNQLLTRLLSLEHKAQDKGRGLWQDEKYRGRSWFRKSVDVSAHWVKQRLKSLSKRKEK